MALSLKYRLSKNREIKEILRGGGSFSSRFFWIKFISVPGLKKFALVVGLKVSKKAVLRNKMKRRTGEIIRRNIQKIKPGYFIVISVKPQAIGEEFKNLERDLIGGLIKIGRQSK